MYNSIDMVMYEQMGFSKEQVKKAFQFSQKNKLDIFDALQYLQRKQNQPVKNQPIPSSNKNTNPQAVTNTQKSVLYPFKNVNLSNFEIIYSKKSSRMSLPGRKVDLRQQFSPVGLLNVYNCCYLNSLLQCYFLSSDLIKYILEAEPLSSLEGVIDVKKNAVKVKRVQNEYNLLNSFKQIFARMALTSSKYIDPTSVLRNLVDSVGEKIEYGEQKDLFETNILIIERLNECLLYTKKYFKPEKQDLSEEQTREDFASTVSNGKSILNQSKIKQRDNIKRLFYGQKVEYSGDINNLKASEQILADFVGIIINPAHGNLYKALYQEFHYEVQIDSQQEKRKIKTKKHTYIREVPTYLYFYINRTGYNAQEKQAMKNEQKLSFDFVIYLDSFMEKYRQQTSANSDTITGLWRKKNMLQKKRNSFDLFAKKLDQCRQLASAIEGWKQKLPQQEDIDQETSKIDKELEDIEKQLQKIESRKQKYCLMYIFVHRGDAVSGHYWGYGRNADNWYKFDINTNKMKEEEILLDLYKCGGTPYALVYAKEDNLPKINYKYYKDFSVASNQQSLLDVSHNNNLHPQGIHVSLIPQGTKKVIIAENILLHQEYTKKRNFEITTKLVKDYFTRFNCVENESLEVAKKPVTKFQSIPLYDNFALYLWTKNEVQLAKYSLYSTSLKAVANMTPVQVMEDEVLLMSIQKEFKKKAKKNKALKHFCIEFEPQQGDKYARLFTDYLEEKQMFLVLLKVIFHIELIAKLSSSSQAVSEQTQAKINKLLRRVALVYKNIQSNNSYIKFILKELTSVFIIQFIRSKCTLRLNQQELNLLVDSMLKKQLKVLAGKQCWIVQNRPIDQKQYEMSRKKNEKAESLWAVEDIGKGPNPEILQKKLSTFVNLTKTEVQIFKKLSKEQKLIQVNPNTGEVQDYNESNLVSMQQQQSLI